MSPPRAILFDFDETLVTLDVDWQGLRSTLQTYFGCYGFQSTFRPLMPALGEARAFAESRQEMDLWPGCLEIMRKAERRGLEKATLMPGARDLLLWLDQREIPYAIISNNDSAIVREACVTFALPPPRFVAGRDTVRNLKPHPEGGQLALQELNAKASETWLVGNSDYDITLGNRLEVARIFILASQELLTPGVIRVASLDEFTRLIETDADKTRTAPVL